MLSSFNSFRSPSFSLSIISAALLAFVAIPALGESESDLWLSSEKPPEGVKIDALSPPDKEGHPAAGKSEETLLGTTMISQRITGSALRPRDSVVNFDVSSTGACIYAEDNAFDTFNTPIWLPQGTQVNQLRMYYNDTSASNSNAWFTVYNLYGEIVDEWNVSSSGDTGLGFNDSAVIDHVIDYNAYSYLLNWRPVAVGTAMQLCGFRILHTPQSPTVFWDRFEQ